MQSFSYSGLAQFSESLPPGSLYMWILKDRGCQGCRNLGCSSSKPCCKREAKRRRSAKKVWSSMGWFAHSGGWPLQEPTDHLLAYNWFRARWQPHIWICTGLYFYLAMCYTTTTHTICRKWTLHTHYVAIFWSAYIYGWLLLELTEYCDW